MVRESEEKMLNQAYKIQAKEAKEKYEDIYDRAVEVRDAGFKSQYRKLLLDARDSVLKKSDDERYLRLIQEELNEVNDLIGKTSE